MAAALRRCGGGLMLLLALVGLPTVLLSARQVWLDVDVGAIVAQPMTPLTLVLAVITTGWLMWAWLVIATVLDTAAVLARRPGNARLLPAPLQTTVASLAGSLLVAVTSVTAGTSSAGAAPPANASMHTAAPPVGTLPVPATDPVIAIPHGMVGGSADISTLQAWHVVGSAGTAVHGTQGQPMTVTVRRGDTLWSISGRCLGDPNRWREIYRLNATRYDQTGRMRGGHHIEPDWVLQLPAGATPGTAGTHTDPGASVPPPSTTQQPQSQSQPSSTASSTTVPQPSYGRGIDQHASSSPAGTAGPVPADAGTGDTDPTRQASDGGQGGSGVWLLTGSWVDAGLVAAIIAAVALVWAHRRRRYVPGTPRAAARHDDADFPAMPPIVRELRRGVRASVPAAFTAPPHADPTGGAADRPAADEPGASSEDDTSVPAGNPIPHNPVTDPRTGHGDDVSDHDPYASTNGDTQPVLGWRRTGGLGLLGPGAQAAARGLLVAAAADGADDPAARSVVLMPAATAMRLFGTADNTPSLPDTPRIVITGELTQAMEQLETIALHRSRLLDQHEVDTIAEVHHADPLQEPLPPTILLCDADALGQHRGRVAALLRQGRPLDIYGILLGAWPYGDTVTVATDGTTTPTSSADPTGPAGRDDTASIPAGGASRATGGTTRMTVLTAVEAADLLNVLVESHTGQPPTLTHPPNGQRTSTTRDASARSGDHITGANIDAGRAAFSGDTAGHDPVADHPDTVPGAAPPTADAAADTALAGDPPSDATTPTTNTPLGALATPDRLIAVDLLGTPRVVNADTSRGSLRAKSLELLAYLAVHDDAVHYETILDDLLPDAPVSKAVHRLHTYISNLRQVLRRAGGADTHIIRTGQRYLLNRDAFDVDLWRMRAALRTAELADTPGDRIAAWRHALHAYRGHLADGVDYEWVEPHREAARRQVIDAALALAGALRDDDPEVALAVLDTAIGHSPYTEALYQAAMHVNAAIGRLDTVRALRRTLTRRLADIDAEPSEETSALADRLLTTAPSGTGHKPRQHQPNPPQPEQQHNQRADQRAGQQPDAGQDNAPPAAPDSDHRPAPQSSRGGVDAPGRSAPPRPLHDTDTDAAA